MSQDPIKKFINIVIFQKVLKTKAVLAEREKSTSPFFSIYWPTVLNENKNEPTSQQGVLNFSQARAGASIHHFLRLGFLNFSHHIALSEASCFMLKRSDWTLSCFSDLEKQTENFTIKQDFFLDENFSE